MKRRAALAVAFAAILCMGTAASDPAERLHDPGKEARARSLFKQIRCLVCQNQSIDESDADLADDLRRIVRQQIVQGRSDAQIKSYLVARYGQFVLLKPSFDAGNAALWLTPFMILGVGGAVIVLRRARGSAEPPLSPEEEARLRRLAETATVPPQPGLTNGQDA